MTKNKKKSVAIILGYHNGEAFIEEQLNSIFSQLDTNIDVFLWDDQSTRPIVKDELRFDDEKLSKLHVTTLSQNIGYTKNFLNGLNSVADEFEYFAFSDQDDIWNEDKLTRAIHFLEASPMDTPALYCARTEVTDVNCHYTKGFSPLFVKGPSFANALVQNIGGGNTMVFNRAAKDLIVSAAVDTNVFSHDWWSYQIVTGAGGYVVYDPEPCLKYRQHANNHIGGNLSWKSRLLRVRKLLQGRFRVWNDINLKALERHKHLLTNDSLNVLNDFKKARQSSLFTRLFFFARSGIHRQTFLGNLGLLLGIVLNKV